jgi:O-antigen/teichoic acid export membrane protein
LYYDARVTVEPRRFVRDVVWNVGSLAIAGVCGIVLNVLIGIYYGPEALGIFNQVFAFYILFSQVAVLGFQYSVLTYIAASDDPEERKAITTTALVITAGIAAAFSLVLWLSAGLVGDVLDSPEVTRGVLYTVPGVFFFALSKVSLACLNGLRRMRWYAIFFGGRFVLMIAAFGICAALDVDRAVLPVILTLAEAATFLLSLPTIRRELGRVPRAAFRLWARKHVHFGTKGLAAGVLTELNTRVDVLILGAFTTDEVVGAYSFAAILAEGAFQLLVVLRTNYAPIAIRLWAEGKRDELAAMVRRARNRVYLGSLLVGALSVGGYIVLLPLLTDEPELLVSWQYFAVLMAGIVASAGYAPFQTMLLYAELPGWHTWLTSGIVVVNAIANVILIYAIGPVGSALGTAIAFVFGVILLRALVYGRMQLRI